MPIQEPCDAMRRFICGVIPGSGLRHQQRHLEVTVFASAALVALCQSSIIRE
jgi:hypothetical protein